MISLTEESDEDDYSLLKSIYSLKESNKSHIDYTNEMNDKLNKLRYIIESNNNTPAIWKPRTHLKRVSGYLILLPW